MNILFVKIAAIGDIIMASGIIGALRSRYPDARITWVTGDIGAPIVQALPGIDEVVAIDERALLTGSALTKLRALATIWRRLAGRSFDKCYVAHSDPRYRLIALTVRAAERHHIAAQRGGFIGGRRHSDEYIRFVLGEESRGSHEDFMPLLRPDLPPAIAAAWPDDRRLILLAPGGARNTMRDNPIRRWPIQSYRDLAGRLRQQGHAVALIGGPGDLWVADSFQGIDVWNLLGKTSLVELMAVMARADVVVSHDSMAAHMPRLVRTPIVALFGPVNPMERVSGRVHECGADQTMPMIPPGPDNKLLWGGLGRACRPCYDGKDFAACRTFDCMQDISVEHVLHAIDQVLVATP